MKTPAIIIVLLLLISSCKKDIPEHLDCGITGITGPVRYYLTPYDKSLFESYRSFHTISFIDSSSSVTTQIAYNSDSQISNSVTGQTQNQGDTVDFGETAGIAYNICPNYIHGLEYYFRAYPNGIDSLNIFVVESNVYEIPAHVFSWSLSLTDTGRSGTGGYTPFVILDSITFLTRTFYDVYLLQNGNYFSPSDSSNNCYFTKANGVVAFTDKRYNRLWVRTTF
jgi:hypothetical protein